MTSSVTNQDVLRIVNRYIGVANGYLGDFSYRTLREFYPEYCGIDVDTERFEGTIRTRFMAILPALPARDQAKVLRGVIARFPVGGEGAPATRTEALRADIERLAERLEGTAAVASPNPKVTSEVLDRAIADAEALLRNTGATSGVDRVHTALHGHLLALCEAAGIAYPAEPSLTQLLKLLRGSHPRLVPSGARADDITKVLSSLATIVDALQPLRNRASVAHPNKQLLDAPEAMLVINATRSILHYLDAKLT